MVYPMEFVRQGLIPLISSIGIAQYHLQTKTINREDPALQSATSCFLLPTTYHMLYPRKWVCGVCGVYIMMQHSF